MNTAVSTTVMVQAGAVRGARRDGLSVFRGIPYARPPVATRRFQPPEEAAPWTGILDATKTPASAPQLPVPAEAPWGTYLAECDEDCLTLDVWSPDESQDTSLPVYVWIHGGGFTIGGGSWPHYDCAELARKGHIVCVSINYRLGVLGFLSLSEVYPQLFSLGNLCLLDIMTALRWVKNNISSFGGDPTNMTVGGQSGGAGVIVALMASPSAEGLFKRAILQSGALAPSQDRRDAAEVARSFVRILGVEQAPEELQRVPIADLLQAQTTLLQSYRRFGDYYPAYQLVADGDLFKTPLRSAISEGWGSGVDVLVGSTRDDGTPAFKNLTGSGVTEDQLVSRFSQLLGPSAAEVVHLYARLRPAEQPAGILGTLLSDCLSRVPALRLAAGAADQGRAAYAYEFECPWPTRELGSCHCVDLPFVFNNFAAWSEAPMLRSADPQEYGSLPENVLRCWTRFVASGDPNHDGIVRWVPYDSVHRSVMRFGEVTDCLADPFRSWLDPLEKALPKDWP